MLENPHKTQLARMLVDLDSILDTRGGTIAKFGKEAYAKVLLGGYFTRVSDHFDGIDPQKYRELYSQRDAVTLAGSMMTHITSLIADFVHRVNMVSASSPVKAVPKIDINVYPYQIPDQIIELIIKSLKIHIQDKVEIDHVSYRPEDLHYLHIKHTYDHMVMYDVSAWLEVQIPEWQNLNRGLPDLTVFSPILSREPDQSKVSKDVPSEAEEVSRMLAPLLNFVQVPVQFFCTVLDPRSLSTSPGAEAPEEGKSAVVTGP